MKRISQWVLRVLVIVSLFLTQVTVTIISPDDSLKKPAVIAACKFGNINKYSKELPTNWWRAMMTKKLPPVALTPQDQEKKYCKKIMADLHSQIIYALQEYGSHIKYWQSQKNHSNWYWLQRSPRYWPLYVDKELKDKIRILIDKQNEYFILLAELTDFSKNKKDIGITRDNLLCFCDKVPFIKYGKAKSIEPVSDLNSMLTIMDNHKKWIAKDMGQYSMPNHFERNWQKYLAAGVLAAGMYWKRDYIAEKAVALKEKATSDVVDLWGSIKETYGMGEKSGFISDDENSAALKAGQKKFTDGMSGIKASFNFGGSSISEEGLQENRVAIIRGHEKDVSMSDEQARSFIENGDKGMRDLTDKAVYEDLPNSSNNPLAGKKSPWMSSVVVNIFKMGYWQLQNWCHGMGKRLDMFGKGIGDAVDGASAVTNKVVDRVDVLDVKVTHMIDVNQVSSRLASVTPLAGAAYGLWKLSSRLVPRQVKVACGFVRPRYNRLRAALSSIYEIINDGIDPDEKIARVNKGKMIFNFDFLKNAASPRSSYLPEEFRDDFLKDIKKLEGEESSSGETRVERKLGSIVRMWNTYPFLNVNYTAQ